jgi:hypothetical protein
MNRWSKFVVLGVGIALVATTAANAAPTAHLQPANPHAKLAPAAAVDTASELKYTAIPSCRIVDTRIAGGALANNGTRSFYALGNTGFGAQGGVGCDIPAAASAVTGSIVALSASANGYLKVFAYGGSLPSGTFMTFNHSLTVGASGTIPVVPGTRNFSVLGVGGSVQLVIQLTGYYVPGMSAEISSSGAYVRGSRVVSVTHIGTGSYQVDFDRDVSGCVYNATSYFYGTIVEVEPRSGDAHGVYIGAADYNGTGVDTYFYLTVTC